MQLVNKTPFDVFVMATQIDPPRQSATLIVKAGFVVVPDAVALPLPDDEQEKVSADQTFMDEIGRSLAWASDLEPQKSFAELVVYGNVYAPGGEPARAVEASVSIGEWQKRLVAFGDRIWIRGADGSPVPSEPTPFTEVPLRWEFSFGGLDDARNPMGRGIDTEVEIAGGGIGIALPNIEDPDALVAVPTDRPEPVNLGPVPPTYEARYRKLGTRDRRWATFRAPLPPDDFDPSYHNAAPEDQQFETAFRGDESVALTGLHPTHPELTFQLPALRIRAFLVHELEGGPQVEETPLAIDTLALRPAEDKVFLIWRGYCTVNKPGLEDILGLYVVSEPLDQPPRPASAYLPEIQEKLFPVETGISDAEFDAEIERGLAELDTLIDDIDMPAGLKQQLKAEKNPEKIFDMLVKEAERQIDAVNKASGLKPR